MDNRILEAKRKVNKERSTYKSLKQKKEYNNDNDDYNDDEDDDDNKIIQYGTVIAKEIEKKNELELLQNAEYGASLGNDSSISLYDLNMINSFKQPGFCQFMSNPMVWHTDLKYHRISIYTKETIDRYEQYKGSLVNEEINVSTMHEKIKAQIDRMIKEFTRRYTIIRQDRINKNLSISKKDDITEMLASISLNSKDNIEINRGKNFLKEKRTIEEKVVNLRNVVKRLEDRINQGLYFLSKRHSEDALDEADKLYNAMMSLDLETMVKQEFEKNKSRDMASNGVETSVEKLNSISKEFSVNDNSINNEFMSLVMSSMKQSLLSDLSINTSTESDKIVDEKKIIQDSIHAKINN